MADDPKYRVSCVYHREYHDMGCHLPLCEAGPIFDLSFAVKRGRDCDPKTCPFYMTYPDLFNLHKSFLLDSHFVDSEGGVSLDS